MKEELHLSKRLGRPDNLIRCEVAAELVFRGEYIPRALLLFEWREFPYIVDCVH